MNIKLYVFTIYLLILSSLQSMQEQIPHIPDINTFKTSNDIEAFILAFENELSLVKDSAIPLENKIKQNETIPSIK